jgi:hypothetical protein
LCGDLFFEIVNPLGHEKDFAADLLAALDQGGPLLSRSFNPFEKKAAWCVFSRMHV